LIKNVPNSIPTSQWRLLDQFFFNCGSQIVWKPVTKISRAALVMCIITGNNKLLHAKLATSQVRRPEEHTLPEKF